MCPAQEERLNGQVDLAQEEQTNGQVDPAQEEETTGSIKEIKELPATGQEMEIPKGTGTDNKVKETQKARERELAGFLKPNSVVPMEQAADTNIQDWSQQTKGALTVEQKATGQMLSLIHI